MNSEQTWMQWLPVAGMALAALCLFAAFGSGRKRRLLENLPTSKTTGVFIGMVELKGTAECATPLTSYLAAVPCVCFEWTVEEHWSRTVIETTTDKDGKTQTTTRQESGWTEVGRGGQSTPFYLQDDCGVVLVRPERALIEPTTVFRKTCGRGDPLYYEKGPARSVADSTHQRQFVERAIPVKTMLFVAGQARERADVVAPEIAHDPNAPIFLISTRTEEQVTAGFKWGGRGWWFFGLVLWLAGWFGRFASTPGWTPDRWPVLLLPAVAYFALSSAVWVWMIFNSLVDVRQRVRQAWAQVEVQLQRRHDLIPNLVEVVKGFRDYESGLQTELATLRTQLEATPPGVAGPDFQAVTPVSRAIAERYPDLKASELFQQLQQNLMDTEQRIALARGYFNEIATHYNTRLETVPERFIARLAGMKLQALMAANDFERAPVTVQMTPPA
jgi:hypothetical protein